MTTKTKLLLTLGGREQRHQTARLSALLASGLQLPKSEWTAFVEYGEIQDTADGRELYRLVKGEPQAD